MSHHTPGPWTVNATDDLITIHAGPASASEGKFEDRCVAEILNTDPEAIHDARLIAAAPELVSALRQARDHAEHALTVEADDTAELLETCDVDLNAIRKILNEAIERAEPNT